MKKSKILTSLVAAPIICATVLPLVVTTGCNKPISSVVISIDWSSPINQNIDVDTSGYYTFNLTENGQKCTRNVTWSIDNPSDQNVTIDSKSGMIAIHDRTKNGGYTIVATDAATQDTAEFDIQLGSFSKLTLLSNRVKAANTDIAGTVVIPNRHYYSKGSSTNISSIMPDAFKNCTKITKVVLPNSPGLTFGQSAFENCSQLQDASFISKINDIHTSMFKGCTSLHDISFSKTLKTIGESAFEGCSGITKISIPSTTKTINKNAFVNSGLTEVEFESQHCWRVSYVDKEVGTLYDFYDSSITTKSDNAQWLKSSDLKWEITSEPYKPVNKLEITNKAALATPIKIAGTCQPTIQFNSDPTAAITDKRVIWYTDSDCISLQDYVTIDLKCTVTGVKAGKAILYAYSYDNTEKYDSVEITVEE